MTLPCLRLLPLLPLAWAVAAPPLAAQCQPVWSPIVMTGQPTVYALRALPDGDVIAAGRFTALDGVAVRNIARWDGATWQPLGSGLDGVASYVAVAPDGDLIVGGLFTTVGGAPARYVARWNGSAWSSLGAGPSGLVLAVAVRPNGEILAATSTGVERWDGSAWTALPGLIVQSARAMEVLPNGDVVITGSLVRVGTTTTTAARWDGTTVHALGGIPQTFARTLFVRRNGELLLGRESTTVGGGDTIVRWNGSDWVPLAGSPEGGVFGLAELPDGDLLIGARTLPGGALARFDGAAWTPVAAVDDDVFDVAVSERGEIFAAGWFTQVGGVASAGFARSVAPCRGSVVPTGAGCTGSAGPVALRADNLPWAGGIFRSTATGMGSRSLAVHVLGLQGTLLPLPLGAPGCVLLVDPLAFVTREPSAGTVQALLAIPDVPAAVGAELHTQVLGIELAAGAVRTTASNALKLTVGTL